jgi:hypothetical protein
MTKLKLDLHDIYNRSDQINLERNRIVEEALEKKISLACSTHHLHSFANSFSDL